jgi:hypothetical protein
MLGKRWSSQEFTSIDPLEARQTKCGRAKFAFV